MSKANALEEQMLKLVNGERADAGLKPLQFNDTLNTSSEDHSSWMLDVDQFDHQGINGSSPHERMKEAGYQFEGNWHSGENIAYMSEGGAPGLADEVAKLHDGLMNSPGHRANILNPDFTEIGIGIENGKFGDASNEFDAVMISQNFAHTEAEPVVPVDPPADPKDDVGEDVVVDDPPADPDPKDDVGEDVVVDDPPADPDPKDDVGEDVVVDDPPADPDPKDDVGEDVVVDDPPTDPEPQDDVGEDVTAATDLWKMFTDMFDGFSGSDSFVFASFATVTNIEDQGALIHAESFVFIPEEFGSFQQVAGQDGAAMAQINDLDASTQVPDTFNVESDLGICGGFESFIG